MKRSSINSMLAAAAIAMAGSGIGAAQLINAREHAPRSKRPGRQPKAIGTSYRRRGATYPEQSSRQAMRGSRRQQGGPGIVINARTHQYEAVSPVADWV